MKVGRKCKWEEIEIGEIFASDGCWIILEKRGNNKWIVLADTNDCFFGGDNENDIFDWVTKLCYKLPLSVQNLWRTP